MKHQPFFDKINWEELRHRRVVAPLLSIVKERSGLFKSTNDDASVQSGTVPAFLRGRGAGYTTASDASFDTSIADFEYLREGAFPPGSPQRCGPGY